MLPSFYIPDELLSIILHHLAALDPHSAIRLQSTNRAFHRIIRDLPLFTGRPDPLFLPAADDNDPFPAPHWSLKSIFPASFLDFRCNHNPNRRRWNMAMHHSYPQYRPHRCLLAIPYAQTARQRRAWQYVRASWRVMPIAFSPHPITHIEFIFSRHWMEETRTAHSVRSSHEAAWWYMRADLKLEERGRKTTVSGTEEGAPQTLTMGDFYDLVARLQLLTPRCQVDWFWMGVRLRSSSMLRQKAGTRVMKSLYSMEVEDRYAWVELDPTTLFVMCGQSSEGPDVEEPQFDMKEAARMEWLPLPVQEHRFTTYVQDPVKVEDGRIVAERPEVCDLNEWESGDMPAYVESFRRCCGK